MRDTWYFIFVTGCIVFYLYYSIHIILMHTINEGLITDNGQWYSYCWLCVTTMHVSLFQSSRFQWCSLRYCIILYTDSNKMRKTGRDSSSHFGEFLRIQWFYSLTWYKNVLYVSRQQCRIFPFAKVLCCMLEPTVDNDPHFVVHVDGLHLPLCFDLHASDGASLSLIQDAESGESLNYLS